MADGPDAARRPEKPARRGRMRNTRRPALFARAERRPYKIAGAKARPGQADANSAFMDRRVAGSSI